MSQRLSDAAAAVMPGLVSVIVLNYKGADDTITCLRGLEALDWPAERLEVICVDNDSGDGSEERIRAAIPGVRVVNSGSNLGFAGGCNFGVALARGEYLAFINNDARPAPGWVSNAVEEFETDPEVVCVASKVLDWDGQLIDFVDGALTWYGMGYKRETERRDGGEYETPRDVLFGTGAAVFFRAETFRAVGGFDERFFMFFEDVDLGWRLNVLGHRVRYVPTSVAYHRHHATMNNYAGYRETYLLERNALMSMYKNYDMESLTRCLAPAMALSIRRSIARNGLDARMLDLQVRPGGDEKQSVEIPKDALAGALAIDYLVDQLPALGRDRDVIQSKRRRSDIDLFPLFRQAMEPAYPYPSYIEAHQHLSEAFGVGEYFSRRRRVLVVTGEPLGSKMAGPAIRAFEMSRLLSEEHDVTLVTLGKCDLEAKEFRVRTANGQTLRPLVAASDLIIFQGLLLSIHPWVAEANAALVADIYDPFHLETLEQERARSMDERAEISDATVLALNVQLARADFLLCASEKQRDFWLGQLAGQGRINPFTYDDDESMRDLIDVAPFGLPAAPARQNRHGIRGVIEGVGADDKVVLWGGGVYNWFDPLTLITAIDQVRHHVPNVRLVFMGMKHPNPGVPEMSMATSARDLAQLLGLEGKHVFFNEAWVPYQDRADFLLDADIGVSCHFDHVETEFSFRTRILDYLWAGLPIVCTQGDAFGDLVAREGLGEAVPPEDASRLADAIIRLLNDDDERSLIQARVRQSAATFTWAKSLEPLARFARNPRRAPDITKRLGAAVLSAPTSEPRRKSFSWRSDLSLAQEYLQSGGVSEFTRRARGRITRVRRERRSPDRS